MFSPNDQSEKISKLKATKERLTRQLEELQREVRDANQENSMLQKQCQDYERRIEKLSTALEKEQEMTGNLKDILSEEKMRVNKLKDDLDRESENVSILVLETNAVKIRFMSKRDRYQNLLDRSEDCISFFLFQICLDKRYFSLTDFQKRRTYILKRKMKSVI